MRREGGGGADENKQLDWAAFIIAHLDGTELRNNNDADDIIIITRFNDRDFFHKCIKAKQGMTFNGEVSPSASQPASLQATQVRIYKQ